MFTGIVEAIGEVTLREARGGDVRLGIATGKLDRADVKLGDSISVNGICLTVVELMGGGFLADVSGETLARTTLGRWQIGDRVNLEKALTPTARMGGHLVSGHVDGVGTVVDRRNEGRSVRFRIEAPKGLARYIAEKGSVCLDGVSLTVNSVSGAVFDLNIVPHTLTVTIIGDYRAGHAVNIEVDLIARYLERLLLGERASDPAGSITQELLARHGFL